MWLGTVCGVGKVSSWLGLLPDLRPWCWVRVDLLLAHSAPEAGGIQLC